MSAFFKKIGSGIGKLADFINGTESPETNDTYRSKRISEQTADGNDAVDSTPGKTAPAEKTAHESQSQPETQYDAISVFNNAIDKRDRAVRLIVDEFREATGSNMSVFASLYVYVIVDCDDFDPKKYAWADETFRQQLRLSLDNAMLESIGRKLIEVRFITSEKIPSKAKCVVTGTLYYSFGSAPVASKRLRARITVIEGTGSTLKNEYLLDSDRKLVYHIGRGAVSRKQGAMRPNDIVIHDSDPDAGIQTRNNHVSSAHADIMFANGRFYLKALKWGCRPVGGASTKIIYDSAEHEVRDTNMKYPLDDDYIIELGKNVMLLFNLIN